MRRKPRVGLALGSGSARGWAHIGAIRALEERGIKADLVCGTSIGALVGAAYASGELDRLEKWVTGPAWTTVVRLMDLTWRGGLIRGQRLFTLFRTIFQDRDIDGLPIPYGAVATGLYSGRELWLGPGNLRDAGTLHADDPRGRGGGRRRPGQPGAGVDVPSARRGSGDRGRPLLGQARPLSRPQQVGRTARGARMARAPAAGLGGEEVQDRGPHLDPLDLRSVQHVARRGGDARREEPPVRRPGRRAGHAAAAGLRHDGLPPRAGGDRRRSRRGRTHGPPARPGRRLEDVELTLPVAAAVLGAALLHAAWNTLVKASGDKELETYAVAAGSGLLALLMIPVLPAPAPASWPWLAGSAAVHILYFVFLAGAYRYGELSYVYPVMRGGGPMIVAASGAAVFAEALNGGQWLGVLLVCGGIVAFASGAHDRRATLFALGNAAVIGAYTRREEPTS